MGVVTEGLMGRFSAPAEEYRLFCFNDLSVGTFDYKRARYLEGPAGGHFEQGLLTIRIHYFDL